MIKCYTCGTEFEDDLTYCPNCGAMDLHQHVNVVGVDITSIGLLEYFKCKSDNIKENDFVQIEGFEGTFEVFDVQRVSLETTDLEISNKGVAQKVTHVPESPRDYYEKKVQFKEGKYQVRYYKNSKEEMKFYNKDINLKIIREICLILGFTLAVASLVAAWFMLSAMEFSRIGMIIILSAALLFTIDALCKEEQRINDVKYVCFKIKQLGNNIVSFDKRKLNIEYVKNDKRITLTTRGK